MAKICKNLLATSLLLSLIACNTPSIGMLNADKTEVNINGVAISVFVKGTEAEAIRTSFARPSQRGMVKEALEKSIIQVSGCENLSDLTYEQWTILRAQLSC